MKEIQGELGRLKAGIDEAKTNIAKLEGREQELLSQLKSEYGLNSIEAAEKEVEKMKKQIEKKEEEIRKQFTILQEDFQW
jgi:flagellar capping protein FliD